jgi:hypothetical protein
MIADVTVASIVEETLVLLKVDATVVSTVKVFSTIEVIVGTCCVVM